MAIIEIRLSIAGFKIENRRRLKMAVILYTIPPSLGQSASLPVFLFAID